MMIHIFIFTVGNNSQSGLLSVHDPSPPSLPSSYFFTAATHMLVLWVTQNLLSQRRKELFISRCSCNIALLRRGRPRGIMCF